jgi:hypothetical protein
MLEFFDVILALPTIVFTALLALVALYWLLVILGALDLDMVGPGVGIEGGGEGSDLVDADGPGDSSVTSLVNTFGLGGVPVTIPLSLVVLFAWLLSIAATQFLAGDAARSLGTLASVAVAVVALGLALPLAALSVRPLRRLFVEHGAPEHRRLVGKVCTITTLRVDDRFGQAEIHDGGAGLLVAVRCGEPNDLTRGSAALIFDYSDLDGTFQVARLEDGAAGDSTWLDNRRSN